MKQIRRPSKEDRALSAQIEQEYKAVNYLKDRSHIFETMSPAFYVLCMEDGENYQPA